MSPVAAPSIKVLLVEDDVIDQLAFTRCVKQTFLPYQYTVATSLAEAQSILECHSFDVAILDFHLGDGTALELVEQVQSHKLPFIIATGSGDEEIAVRLMQHGAYDYLIKDPDRHYLKILSTTVDKAIARKQAEEQIQLLTHAVQHVRDGIYIADQDHRLVFINESLGSICNCSPEVVIGQPIQKLNQPALTQLVTTMTADFSGLSSDREVAIAAPNGELTPMLLSESYLVQPGDQYLRIGILRNISSLKQVEQDLRIAQENLEHKVAERTAQLQQANRALEDLNTELEHRVALRTAELQEREAQLQDFLDNANDLIQSVQLDTSCLEYVNKAWRKTLGYTEADVQTMTLLDVLHPTCHLYYQDIVAAMRSGSLSNIEQVELTFITKDHRKVLVEGSINCRYVGDQPVATRAILRDITDRRQAEQALQNSEKFLDSIIENIPDMIFVKDAQDLRFIRFNKAGEELLGYSREELLGNNDYDFFPQDEADQFTAQDRAILASHQVPEPLENKIHTRHQGVRFLHTKKLAITDEEGNPQYLLGISEDVTDRKQIEQAMNRQLAAIEAAIDGIAILQDNTYIYLNQAHLSLFGYEQTEELLGKTWQVIYSSQEIDRFQQEIFPTLERDRSWQGEAIATRKDGTQFAEGLSLTLTDEGLLICVCRDISDRKQYEVQLQQTNEQLARATRLKDEFLANMSHELRTPLNAILGMTEGLQDSVFGEINPLQLKALKTIERSSNHLLELINDILDLAKIEAGQVTLEYSATKINQLCQSSLVFIRQQALKKQIQLQVTVPEGLPNLWVDERRMRQVLINLLTNAVKFTPDGGSITLEVSLVPPTGTRPLAEIQFAVIDTGIGIAPENVKKLFQPFIQVDSALNRQYQGTGLGLSLVKRIVEMHGGEVGLQSQVGVGSRFTITLPLTEGTPPFTPLEADATLEFLLPEAAAIAWTAPCILLAEDNEANIETMVSYLTAKGYEVIVANRGQDVVPLAQAERPDLILMDVQMPEVDGLAAIQQIRQIPELATLPIVALTALAMADDRERCLNAGANDYLTKPVKLKQLVVTIQHWLAQTRSAPTSDP
ncbi:PAS domain S-box protein [Alkalinema sp. FACHB-956]|uniref:PAS domain S-box protein n=1 Tax=Alkalinema sp. FACHB-956 TaxID=2692768 RepID=UPI0016867AA6|nr:PAS domain S-box protein [Alkalinema sp. FACHB-956]MBD2328126.1 PAS domain S-box protein [Alkalinema sp. FACHB-956]